MNLTLAEARDLLKRAVENRGEEFIYDKDEYNGVCAYFDSRDGTPGCIIGQVLSFKGVTLESLLDYQAVTTRNGGYPPNLNTTGVTDLADHEFLNTDPTTLEYLAIAQTAQDTGHSWGTALLRAEAWAELGVA